MKRIIPALVAVLLAGGGAYAQSLNIGPGGISVDPRSPRERAIDREIRREDRAREFRREERARDRDAYERRRDWEYHHHHRGNPPRRSPSHHPHLRLSTPVG